MDMNHKLLSGSSLNDAVVENRNGQTVGSIKDVMIDSKTGQVSYAVLAVDAGFLNLGSKYFAIPLQALTFDYDNKRILVDISKEKLKNSPGFDKDNWPSGPQSEFIGSVYDFYEVPLNDTYSAAVKPNRETNSVNVLPMNNTEAGFQSQSIH